MTRFFGHLFLAAAAGLAPGAAAETRRAVMVGIDRYVLPAQRPDYKVSPRTAERRKAVQGASTRKIIPSLDGSFNDVKAVRDVLVARFGFKTENIFLLPNPDTPAYADNILGYLEKHLIDDAQPGDVSLFYYAGHGSRILNKGTANTSGYDSTIIPADSLLGAPDIRSKELARIYARAAAKHVTLTVIQDSCFSGGGARGISGEIKVRALPPIEGISVDEKLETALPEESGVLILSASQDYQPAQELSATDLGGSHGAFTWALVHVLTTSPPDASVDVIFRRTRALMQSKTSGQEPVLLARNGRNERGLFGQPATESGTLAVAVASVDEAGGVVHINGGAAMDLRAGCEFANSRQPEAVVRITALRGAASSDAQVIAGKIASFKPGDLLLLKKWVPADAQRLAVYIAPSVPAGLKDKLNIGPKSDNDAVSIVDKPELADYLLASRMVDGQTEYRWESRAVESEKNVRPTTTIWVTDAAGLTAAALKLCRVIGWQTLDSPPNGAFPYDLALQDAATHQFADGPLVGGREYKLFLKRQGKAGDVPPRRIYIFVVDNSGEGTLLFPRGNLENELPQKPPDLIELTKRASDFKVSKPFGMDTYILLTSEEPIDNPEMVFNFQGVHTRGIASPLTQLLRRAGSGTRGVEVDAPANWSVKQFFLKSEPPK